MELVARRLVERGALVRADLRLDVERAQERERAAGDGRAREVEVDGDVAAAAQVRAAGDVEEPGQLGEPVAVASRRDRGELVAEILREQAHSSTPRARAGGACSARPSEP